MASLNEIVYAIKENIKDYSDDVKYPNRYIEFLVHTKRNEYVKNNLDSLRTNVPLSLFSSVCLDMEVTDSSSCCDVDTGCTVVRTVNALPLLIENKYRHNYSKVSSPGIKADRFNYIPLINVDVLDGAPFYNSIYWTQDTDGRVYLFSRNPYHKAIEKINIKGIFSKIDALYTIDNCNGTSCASRDDEYPLPDDYIPSLITELTDLLLKIDKSTIPDLPNDSEPNPQA